MHERATAYAEATLNGRVGVLGWRLYGRMQRGDDDVLSGLRELQPKADWLGPAGRMSAAILRVWVADASIEAGEHRDARALVDDALLLLRRCCRDSLAAARAEFTHARLLWHEGRREEAVAIARATKTLYDAHDIEQRRMSGLVDQWLGEHPPDAPAPESDEQRGRGDRQRPHRRHPQDGRHDGDPAP